MVLILVSWSLVSFFIFTSIFCLINNPFQLKSNRDAYDGYVPMAYDEYLDKVSRYAPAVQEPLSEKYQFSPCECFPNLFWFMNQQKRWMGWPCDTAGSCWQGAYITPPHCLTHGITYYSWQGLYLKNHYNVIWQYDAVRSEDFCHDFVQGYLLHRDPAQGCEVQQRYTNILVPLPSVC
jgi:hypothetical protein